MTAGTDPTADAAAAHRRGTLDLLGVVAYGELSAFERMAADAATSPTLQDRVRMAAMARAELEHFDQVAEHVAGLGADVVEVMAPFRAAFDTFHTFTAPRSWLEGLVKTYVGDGFAADFYREVAAYVDGGTRACVHAVLANESTAEYVVDRVRAAIADDPRVAGRLALWGRRLVGEALSQAQRVAAEREDLTGLLAGTPARPGMDLTAIARMFTRLVERHTERMAALGLAS
ncbi:hydroxylase [Desertihabitans brevis]|uniref:Hydroxylase n=1 Tax=Desertihabitans brevis TaxID=2268447 RepID=A0A367YYE8_9ACTN|nr:ferritin-like fold-containing protein [Desertihabitans brevis]RCK70935.1 hydroxylase [Desertihabitans brevis]